MASCLDCTTKLCSLLDVADAWRSQQGQHERAALQEYIRTALVTVQQRLVVTRVLVGTAIVLSKRRKGLELHTGSTLEFWTLEDCVCVLSEDLQGFILSVDTKNAAYNEALVRFSLVEAESGEEHVAGLLLLHPHPLDDSHFVASARLEDVTLRRTANHAWCWWKCLRCSHRWSRCY